MVEQPVNRQADESPITIDTSRPTFGWLSLVCLLGLLIWIVLLVPKASSSFAVLVLILLSGIDLTRKRNDLVVHEDGLERNGIFEPWTGLWSVSTSFRGWLTFDFASGKQLKLTGTREQYERLLPEVIHHRADVPLPQPVLERLADPGLIDRVGWSCGVWAAGATVLAAVLLSNCRHLPVGLATGGLFGVAALTGLTEILCTPATAGKQFIRWGAECGFLTALAALSFLHTDEILVAEMVLAATVAILLGAMLAVLGVRPRWPLQAAVAVGVLLAPPVVCLIQQWR